jgi:hypothetical protein
MGERLAYQLLYEALASFGGGPNVNSRCTATKGGLTSKRDRGREGQK